MGWVNQVLVYYWSFGVGVFAQVYSSSQNRKQQVCGHSSRLGPVKKHSNKTRAQNRELFSNCQSLHFSGLCVWHCSRIIPSILSNTEHFPRKVFKLQGNCGRVKKQKTKQNKKHSNAHRNGQLQDVFSGWAVQINLTTLWHKLSSLFVWSDITYSVSAGFRYISSKHRQHQSCWKLSWNILLFSKKGEKKESVSRFGQTFKKKMHFTT